MFEKCANCGSRGIRPITTEQGVFCSRECRDYAVHPGFCPDCVAATLDRSSGPMVTVNGIGSKLYSWKDQCPVCGSVEQRMFFCVAFIPIIPQAKYRVKPVSPNRFLSRQVPPPPKR